MREVARRNAVPEGEKNETERKTVFLSLPQSWRRDCRQDSPLVRGGKETAESLHKPYPPSDEGGVKTANMPF